MKTTTYMQESLTSDARAHRRASNLCGQQKTAGRRKHDKTRPMTQASANIRSGKKSRTVRTSHLYIQSHRIKPLLLEQAQQSMR